MYLPVCKMITEFTELMIRHFALDFFCCKNSSAEAVLRISDDSSCIFSAASHASIVLGDVKNDIRVIFTSKMLRYRRLILQLSLRRPSLFCSNTLLHGINLDSIIDPAGDYPVTFGMKI